MTTSIDPPQTGAVQPSRRDVLATGAGFLAAIAGLSLLSPDARAADAPRPHILYIMADDLGFADVGFHGSDIQTPNLDRLAQSGARLGQFYAQPMCTPTRAALMTGRYPVRYGLQTGVIPSGASYGLPTDEFLLSQALKDAGYRTALVGKWHLGHASTEFWPRQRGFDSFYAPLVGEIDHYKHEAHGVTDWYRDNVLVKEEGGPVDPGPRRGDAAVPLPRVHGTPHALPGARDLSGALCPYRGSITSRLCRDDHGDGRADRRGSGGTRGGRHARRDAHPVPQ
jgi:hypothetical protein